MVDLKERRTQENEQMRTMVLSAVKAQKEEEQAQHAGDQPLSEEQERALDQLLRQARGRPSQRGFVTILHTGA